jgi:uncharacterized protein YodC (DUF2158 family)
MPPATSGPLQQQEARAGDGGEAEAEAEEGQGGLLGPFMAVHVAAGRVGVAWYDGATAEVRRSLFERARLVLCALKRGPHSSHLHPRPRILAFPFSSPSPIGRALPPL